MASVLRAAYETSGNFLETSRRPSEATLYRPRKLGTRVHVSMDAKAAALDFGRVLGNGQLLNQLRSSI